MNSRGWFTYKGHLQGFSPKQIRSIHTYTDEDVEQHKRTSVKVCFDDLSYIHIRNVCIRSLGLNEPLSNRILKTVCSISYYEDYVIPPTYCEWNKIAFVMFECVSTKFIINLSLNTNDPIVSGVFVGNEGCKEEPLIDLLNAEYISITNIPIKYLPFIKGKENVE